MGETVTLQKVIGGGGYCWRGGGICRGGTFGTGPGGRRGTSLSDTIIDDNLR